MKKTTLLKIVNFIVAILFIVQAATGIGHSWLPEQIFIVHGYTGFAFTFFIIVHIVLNWSWVRSNFINRKKTQQPTKE